VPTIPPAKVAEFVSTGAGLQFMVNGPALAMPLRESTTCRVYVLVPCEVQVPLNNPDESTLSHGNAVVIE
jgi:hypothetical protein